MNKSRLEAFSDGVIAILITIMVLEFKVPSDDSWVNLIPLIPVLLSYILSFIFLGIYWNNHHHLMHAAKQVNGAILWANMHLLFWLSMTPFATAWMGETGFSTYPVAVYGIVLLCTAIAYYILAHTLLSHHGTDSVLAKALGRDVKGKISLVIYLAAIPLCFYRTWVACALYVVVAIIWLVPDKRIERALLNS